MRKAVTITQRIPDPSKLIACGGHIVANPPNEKIYDFKGVFETSDPAIKKSIATHNSDEHPMNEEGG